MDKTAFLKATAVILLLSILFTPQDSYIWLYFFIPGIILGVLWYIRLD